MCRNPLKSGQCFLQSKEYKKGKLPKKLRSQSPQIGSMFLTEQKECGIWHRDKILVAIPSNRVNVSYIVKELERFCIFRPGSQSPQIGSMFLTEPESLLGSLKLIKGRNPLKSGQCFLPNRGKECFFGMEEGRNPLKSGQCFLQRNKIKPSPVWDYRRNPLKSGQCFLP